MAKTKIKPDRFSSLEQNLSSRRENHLYHLIVRYISGKLRRFMTQILAFFFILHRKFIRRGWSPLGMIRIKYVCYSKITTNAKQWKYYMTNANICNLSSYLDVIGLKSTRLVIVESSGMQELYIQYLWHPYWSYNLDLHDMPGRNVDALLNWCMTVSLNLLYTYSCRIREFAQFVMT